MQHPDETLENIRLKHLKHGITPAAMPYLVGNCSRETGRQVAALSTVDRKDGARQAAGHAAAVAVDHTGIRGDAGSAATKGCVSGVE